MDPGWRTVRKRVARSGRTTTTRGAAGSRPGSAAAAGWASGARPQPATATSTAATATREKGRERPRRTAESDNADSISRLPGRARSFPGGFSYRLAVIAAWRGRFGVRRFIGALVSLVSTEDPG